MDNKIKEILKKPYHWVLIPEANTETGEIGWSALIEEFCGCYTCGDTKEQALSNLQDCAEIWLEAALEQPELVIPDPIPDMEEDHCLYKINCRIKHYPFDKLVGEK